VGISSGGEIHVDAYGEIFLDAPKISLGGKIDPSNMIGMEPVLLGYKTNQILIRLSEALEELAQSLGTISETDVPGSMFRLATSGPLLLKAAQAINNQVTGGGVDPRLASNLSKRVYTK
jgi:hypothetical protein